MRPLIVTAAASSGCGWLWAAVFLQVCGSDSPACPNFQAQDAKTSLGRSVPAVDDNPRTSIGWISKFHSPDFEQDALLGLHTSNYAPLRPKTSNYFRSV